MQLIDIGVNFHNKQLSKYTPELISRAQASGLSAILATGTSLETTMKAINLASEHPGFIYATAGVHPHNANDWSPEVRLWLEKQLFDPVVVAVGECGLDYSRMFSSKTHQLQAFRAQLSLSLDTGKPLFLHCRDAFDDFVGILKGFSKTADKLSGVVHCFTDSWAEAKAYLDLGLDIGVTGWVTDVRRGNALRDAVIHIPLDRLHLETDAPYLCPKNLTTGRSYNEPANLIGVAKELAAIKNVPVEELVSQCTANSQRLFKLS